MVLPFDPTLGVKGVSVGKIFATMLCMHINFSLICNMSNFRIGPPPPKSTLGDPGLQTKILFHIYYSSACMQNFSKNINNCLIITKFKYLTLTPQVGSKRWGKILTLPCLSTGTGQSWSKVRSC